MGGGPFDAVNLGNLNVHFAVPVLHKAGRGIPFAYDLSYDSSIWAPVTSNGTTTWTPVTNWGWTGSVQSGTGWISFDEIDTFPIQNCQVSTYTNYVYHDSFGSPHPFAGKAVWQFGIGGHSCTSHFTGFTANSGDGSAYSLNINNSSGTGTLTAKDGTAVGAPFNQTSGVSAALTDSNGNKVTSDTSGHFFDTLSSSVAVLTVSGSGTQSSPTTLTYASPTGSATYTVNYTAYTVQTAFNFGSDSSPIQEYHSASAVNLVTSIALPDDTSTQHHRYTFTYEATTGSCQLNSGTTQCVTGRIASVTLPSGGTITYVYSGGTHNTGIYSDGSTAGLNRILAASTTCSSANGCWQYVRALQAGTPGPGSTWQTTITDPMGPANQTVINFAEDSTVTNGSTTIATYNLYETQRQVFQGNISINPCSATVTTNCILGTAIKCYNGHYATCSTATVTSPISSMTVYSQLPNGNTRASQITYNGSFTGSGLVSDDQEFDYGVTLGSAPSSTLLRRETAISYARLGNGIINKPSIVTVSDWSTGSAVTIGSTTYTYDQGTATPTIGTPQHVSITGSRGNATTVMTQTTNTATLTKTFTYYDTGNVNVATDVNGAQTTYGYSSNSCINSFADSVTAPLSLTSSMVWNCTGGVVTKATDANGNFVTTTYTDAFFWRPASATDATQANTTNFTYKNYNPNTSALGSVESQMTFTGTLGNSIVEGLSTFDTLGRPLYAQQEEGVGLTQPRRSTIRQGGYSRPRCRALPGRDKVAQPLQKARLTMTEWDAL